MRPAVSVRRLVIEVGRGLIVLSVAGAFIGVFVVSGAGQGRGGVAGAAGTQAPASVGAESPTPIPAAPLPSLEPTLSPTAEPSPTDSPTAPSAPTPQSTVVEAATPAPSCTQSGSFGSILSACGVSVTVVVTDDTSVPGDSGDPGSGAYTQAYAFVITATFTDSAMGDFFHAILNGGDCQGIYYLPDAHLPLVSGQPLRIVVFGRPGVSLSLFLSFSAHGSPTFNFS